MYQRRTNGRSEEGSSLQQERPDSSSSEESNFTMRDVSGNHTNIELKTQCREAVGTSRKQEVLIPPPDV